MSTHDNDRLMSAREVADHLGFPSMAAFYAWRHRTRTNGGRSLPAVRVGRNLRFDPEDVDRFKDDSREQTR